MGSITIVNLTDSSLHSAIANADNIHSGINGVLPHAYYHHNALSGTGYDVWEKWYVHGITEDFPHSDISKIGWYVGSALLVAAGIGLTIATAGAAAPALAALQASILTAEAAAGAVTAATSAVMVVATDVVTATAAAVLADAAVTTAWGAFLVAAAPSALGGIIGITGIGISIGSPIADYVASLEKRVVGPVWGQSNRILSFTGNIPLDGSKEKNAEGKEVIVGKMPTGMTAQTAPPPTFAGDLTPQVFDMMRRTGQIYQIKHRDGKYGDLTQGFVRKNLRGGEGKEKKVTHGGITLDISKIYKIQLLNSNSYLTAGEDESDNQVYLRDENYDQELSCCYWQFIPTREQGGGWILVDRLNVRFLYWSGSAMLQYPSEELGKAGIKIDQKPSEELGKAHTEIDQYGWAQKIGETNKNGQVIKRDWPKGMVWNLSSFNGSLQGSIEQPGTDRICVTAHTTDGSQIDAISFRNQPALQTWVVKAVDDGSDYKAGVKLSGAVYLQDTGEVPLVNDKFAGTRGQSRRLEGFVIKFNPPIPGLDLEYMAHLKDTGDTKWVKGGEFVGTTGQSRRLEGFAIKLTGAEAAKYRVSYMAHITDFGDTDFFHDGEFCGTRGQSRQVEGIQVHVEKR